MKPNVFIVRLIFSFFADVLLLSYFKKKVGVGYFGIFLLPFCFGFACFSWVSVAVLIDE